MHRPGINSRLIPNLLLAAFLVAAQWGLAVHAFEHKAGTQPSQVCTTCVAASQLGFACIDTPLAAEPLSSCSELSTDSAQEIESLHALLARQRGPPSSL